MDRHFLLWIVLCSSCSFIAAKQVTNSVKPAVYQVIEGNDLHVNCNANHITGFEIFWLKNETNSEFRQNSTDLTFKKVDRNATGIYICFCLNLTADINATIVEVISVDVLYPAEIRQFLKPTVVVENDIFNVFCSFDGNPTPDFIIMNNNSKHVYTGAAGSKELHIEVRASCENAGTWICTGSNVLNKGQNVTRSGNLTVFCRPSPKNDWGNYQYNHTAELGGSTLFILENYGYPYPNYTWSHNGETLSPDMHVDLGYVSVLNISNIQVEDFGTYYLDMMNTYGTSKARFELIPAGLPERPSNLTYSKVTQNSVLLNWTSGFDMGSPQYFIVIRLVDGLKYEYSEHIDDNAANHGVGEKFSHAVTDLDPYTWYTFDVCAVNMFGVPVFSGKHVEFRTNAAPVTMSPDLQSQTPLALILGCTLGGLGFLGVLAFLAFLVIYRIRRKSSVKRAVKEQTKIETNTPLQQPVGLQETKNIR